MDTRQMSVFFRRLARGMAAETMGDQSDGQLVERFLASRDDTVFEAIVRRHGPMIFRVCWRVLQDEQEAEDALQATFLVLAQKLHTVRKRTSLASWLHGVAHRVALKAKAQVAARQRHERQASTSGAVPSDEVTWKELRTVLDAELAQLPEKWRLPLILCYLEGRTQDEAAGQLGCGERTLRRRLDEARAALGRRLSQRGIVWPAALVAVLLSECVAPAAMKLGVVRSTVEIAAHVVAGQATTAIVPAKVAALAEGVMKAMFISKLKVVAAMFLALGVVAAGVSALTQQTQAARQPETGAAAQPKGEKLPVNGEKTPPGKEADKPKTDQNAIQGMWKVVEGVRAGGDNQPDFKKLTVEITKDRFVFKPGTIRDFSYKLDPSKKPKHIDTTNIDGLDKDDVLEGIYSLEGDELTISLVLQGTFTTRPTDFKDGRLYLVLRRQKADKPKADKERPQAAPAKVEKVLKLEGPATSVLWSPGIPGWRRA